MLTIHLTPKILFYFLVFYDFFPLNFSESCFTQPTSFAQQQTRPWTTNSTTTPETTPTETTTHHESILNTWDLSTTYEIFSFQYESEYFEPNDEQNDDDEDELNEDEEEENETEEQQHEPYGDVSGAKPF
jgi:hypothetical protein